jgi:hypothetical protein
MSIFALVVGIIAVVAIGLYIAIRSIPVIDVDELIETATGTVKDNYLSGVQEPSEKQKDEAVRRAYNRVESALSDQGIDIRDRGTEMQIKAKIRQEMFS